MRDYKRDCIRLWLAPDGGLIALNSRFQLNDYKLRRHLSGGATKPVSVLTLKGDFAGILMPIRPDDALSQLIDLADKVRSAVAA
mgnify:CR=1 FL=1